MADIFDIFKRSCRAPVYSDMHSFDDEDSPASYNIDAEDTDVAISLHASIESIPPSELSVIDDVSIDHPPAANKIAKDNQARSAIFHTC